MLPCPIKHIIGFDCPGCGIQRSINFLTELNIKESFEIYPPLIICIGFTFSILLIKTLFKKEHYSNLTIKGNLVIILTNFIIKLLI
ncbi:MAG: DUF2752 domain-containing protein [Bacteroidetes bacterium]|nr:DUF2752 domain-containing protein [Bacteroidota bacterium]